MLLDLWPLLAGEEAPPGPPAVVPSTGLLDIQALQATSASVHHQFLLVTRAAPHPWNAAAATTVGLSTATRPLVSAAMTHRDLRARPAVRARTGTAGRREVRVATYVSDDDELLVLCAALFELGEIR